MKRVSRALDFIRWPRLSAGFHVFIFYINEFNKPEEFNVISAL